MRSGTNSSLMQLNPGPVAPARCMWTIKRWRVDAFPKPQPYVFSADEGVDVGEDDETAVSNDYKQGDNKFTGKIVKVTVAVQASGLSPADQKAVSDAEDRAAIGEE